MNQLSFHACTQGQGSRDEVRNTNRPKQAPEPKHPRFIGWFVVFVGRCTIKAQHQMKSLKALNLQWIFWPAETSCKLTHSYLLSFKQLLIYTSLGVKFSDYLTNVTQDKAAHIRLVYVLKCFLLSSSNTKANNALVCHLVLSDVTTLWLSAPNPQIPNEEVNHFLEKLGSVAVTKHYAVIINMLLIYEKGLF